jgi:hypothetical protein
MGANYLEQEHKAGDEAWRELAVETIRNLSRLVEDAEALLRKAEQQLRDLQDRAT